MNKMKGAALIAVIILSLIAGLTSFVHNIPTDNSVGGVCATNGTSS